jgi:predicted TIM-barrel fold metal-dependent hydrolase
MHMHVGASASYWGSRPAETVAAVRSAGFSGAVVFPFDRGSQPNYGVPNDRIIGSAAKWGDLCPFGRVDTKDVSWSLDELARLREAGCVGLKLHPVFDNVDPYDLATERVLRRAGELGLTVILHTNIFGAGHPNEWATVIRGMPDVTFILGHAGMYAWRSALELACTCPNVYLESSLCESLVLEKIAEFCPPERILFGSDHPYGDNLNSYRTLWRALALVYSGDELEAACAAVFHDNAARLLKRAFEPVAQDPPRAESGAHPLVAAVLAARDQEIPCSVYKLAQRDCSFIAQERQTNPLDGDILRIKLFDRWHEVPVTVLYGNGERYFAEFKQTSSDLMSAIIQLNSQVGAP